MDAPESVIVATQLGRRYGTLVAVDDIDFHVQRSECLGFLGPNGAGKSTTMRMIYRATPVGSGRLEILGYSADGAHDRAIKQRLGVVPQEDNLDQRLSVRENLEIFARFYRLPRARARERIDELMEFADLTGRPNAPVETLSGGLRRRVQIARGLLGSPEILILDEPTTGLDPQARHRLWEKLHDLRRRDTTLVLTTHYMEEAEQLCDRILIMDHGHIVAQGSPAELIAEHVTSHVVQLDRIEDVAKLERLGEAAERSEQLGEHILLYTNDGEALMQRVMREAPEAEPQYRRSTLEDVFLRITGRELRD